MREVARSKVFIIFLIIIMFSGCMLYINMEKNQNINNCSQNPFNQIQCDNCVVGLLSDNNGGSNFVVYETETWDPTVILNLPDVSPDNYGAISNDGNYIAYTKWDEYYARRYLEVYSLHDGKVKSFYQDIPARNEVIKISWLPDNKTLLFIINDTTISSYQQIRTLNVETEEENTLVKGEVWRIRALADTGTIAEDFYLKGQESYLKVKDKKPVDSYDNNNPINPDIEWNYYLDQNDLDEIYHYYGGGGTFDIENVLNLMYVNFSAPRCSKDGTKIIYSATLDRNSVRIDKLGAQTPTWMSSAIWIYDIKSDQASIVYAQTDDGAIGRVDWIDDFEFSFISYYDFQGSRDSVNYFNLSTNEHRILFPYTDENYNNVTLLPIGNRKITFTTSKKGDFYEESSTILFDIDANTYSEIDVKFGDDSVLLENFIFSQLRWGIIP